MGPRLPALLIVVLAGRLLPARGCVMCDPNVRKMVDHLETTYLPGHLETQYHEDFLTRVKQALEDFKDLPIDEDAYMGVIDQPTLEKVSWSLIKDIKRMTESDVKGELFVKEFLWMLKMEKDIFARVVGRFQRQAFCPNKCGTMLQTLIWCRTCKKQVHACHKSMDCGERHISVHLLEDLVLNCELNWHQASEGLTTYSFYRVWENNTKTLLSEGKEPTLSKPMVGPEDEGKYSCVLGSVQNTPATILHYRVKVLPKSREDEIVPADADKRITSRPLPGSNSHIMDHTPTESLTPEPKKLQKSLITILIWTSLVLILALAFILFCFRFTEVAEWLHFAFGAAPKQKVPEEKDQDNLDETVEDSAQDKAEVKDKTEVKNKAKVKDKAAVKNKSKIMGKAEVKDKAEVQDMPEVKDNVDDVGKDKDQGTDDISTTIQE
ncbi:izumo sperm-egg fusion protein 1 [Suncus etruscus]|uniref:izumo sperm-egg fusion protein 1 n=1 Tax=Suncus etruscus TaxID=109475 RepID=UPI00210FDA35|nr:izumo sperm-egg fusion protein 1 [Suncus etruscus]